MRNSSLVEWFSAEDVTGLKRNTEAAGCSNASVEERCVRAEAGAEAPVDITQERMPV